MSDHLLFAVSCFIRADAPTEVKAVLRFMVDPEHYAPPSPPDHPAFREDSVDGEVFHTWHQLFQTSSNYFPGPFGAATESVDHLLGANGHPLYAFSLTFRCGVHEDDMGYYGDFLDWLSTYGVNEYGDGFVGYVQDTAYAEPRLLYFSEGKLWMGNGEKVWQGWKWWPGP